VPAGPPGETARPKPLRRKLIGGISCELPNMETNTHLRCTLNHLIQTCKDGQEGYLTAAENVSDAEAKTFFNECSLQRAKFTGELQTLAHELGDSNPEYASSVSGALHRGWINLKSAVLSGDAHAILRECERGESIAVSEFTKALELALPANIREIVSRQCGAITEAHHRVRAMADAGAHWV
jgi:uncharacterized protein (TIGR02284 family)